MTTAVRMRRMVLVHLISLFLIYNNLHHPPFVTCSSSSFSSYNNRSSSLSSMRCHPEESFSLLGFKNSMSFNQFLSWKKGTDCCEWHGITCDPTSHHVVGLELSLCELVGSLDSNSTLFHLRHLRFLSMFSCDFSHSPISPKFGSSFPYLEELQLIYCNFSGEVPDEISHLSKLQSLNLNPFSNGLLQMKRSTFNNIIANMTHLTYLLLSGVNIDSTIPPSFTNLSSLIELDLTNCNLSGELPANLLNLPFLGEIRLGGNRGLYAKFPLSNWTATLHSIDLSSINFSTKLPSFSFQSIPSKLISLSLSGCNFYGQIPNWVWKISIGNNPSLMSLDLSDNKLDGAINLEDIHSKLLNFDRPSVLWELNISYNSLSGSFTRIPWNSLETLDLSHNMFDGPLPVPPIQLTWFTASNNNFTGNISSSFCKTFPKFLDFSNNYLNGELPYCLGNISDYLIVLNLGSNFISGTLPEATFSKCSELKYLDLSHNLLEGAVPRLLSHCKRLQVLNFRSNKFRDKFPHWLATFSYIQILDLSNNGFFGLLPHSKPFPNLQILDLSNNHFSGKIPIAYIESFISMMNITPGVGSPEYMDAETVLHRYFYSITLTYNAVEIKYPKIIKDLATFDLSNNKFEGEIPNNIGQLVSIHTLNLSHNLLTGPIPKSLGNLTLLNSLDLSSNKLSGQIPKELTSLSSLGSFNVSDNQLEGPIPHDNHFETFSVDSYKGNVGLCGFPLPDCGEQGKPRPLPSKNDNKEEDVGMMPEWKVVMMGCGFGTFVSFVWGCYMLSIEIPLWLLKLVLFLVNLLKKHLFVKCRRPRRGGN